MQTMMWRDSSGRTLDEYPRPSVAVDVAVLTVQDESLAVLLLFGVDPYDDSARWSLPGGFVHPGERLADTAGRVLLAKCGIEDLQSRQLHVFDDPQRDPRGWVMSVAHASTVPHASLFTAMADRTQVRLAPVAAGSPVRVRLPRGQRRLPFDHDAIVAWAVADIRDRYSSTPDPDRLLGQTFSVRQLQRVHEAVVGTPWHKDAFRRLMDPHLVVAPGKDRSGYGPPAQLFRRLADKPLGASEAAATASVAGYTHGELLQAVADFLRHEASPTVEGYRTWARENKRPSDAWVRKRLGESYGGWPDIVAAARHLSHLRATPPNSRRR
jgi:8-oxo-dGTP diphosphatase